MNKMTSISSLLQVLTLLSVGAVASTMALAHDDAAPDHAEIHPNCDGSAAAESFPIAAGGWDKVEGDHAVIVHPEVRSSLMTEFCTAALEMHEENNVALTEIDARAPQVFGRYVERFLSQGRMGGRSLSAILTKELGGLVMSIPRSRKFAVLSVTYEGDIDQVQIRQDVLAKADRYIIPVGSSIVAGLYSDEISCVGMIKIYNNDRNKFACVANNTVSAGE